uniref:hypothetical protein n=1 Tax=Flavobacterium sp. Root935 TaxID=1736610 RepID=UPI0018E3F4BE|nr:hypothetical protein [Flavobacterium sp. Root935]
MTFLLDGVFRLSCYNDKGEEITNYLIYDNQFFADYEKLEVDVPAFEYLQAVVDCELLISSKKDWYEISNTIIGLDKMYEKMYSKCPLPTIEKRRPLV